MTQKPYILAVEDEREIAIMIKYNLESSGFEVKAVDDGIKAMQIIEARKPDLILLDWMLPSLSGIEVCHKIRKDPDICDIPVIMLTARGEEADKIRGLDSGADDYIVKPFSPKELVSRIKAILRRVKPSLTQKNVEYAGIEIDVDSHKVKYGDKTMRLGPTEYRLLLHFIEKPKKIFSREQLLNSVWGMDIYVESRTVDVHIRRLRKVLDETQEGLGSIIKTVRSAGYMLEKD